MEQAQRSKGYPKDSNTGLLSNYTTSQPNFSNRSESSTQILNNNPTRMYEPEKYKVHLNYDIQPDWDLPNEKRASVSKKWKIVSVCAGLLSALVLVTVLVNFIGFEKVFSSSNLQTDSPTLQKLTAGSTGAKKLFQFDDMYDPKFRPDSVDLTWVKVDDKKQDGAYTYEDESGNIWLKYAGELWDESNSSGRVVITRKLIDSDDTNPFTSYTFSPDLKYLVVANSVNKVWRHSFTAQYRIFDLSDLKKAPWVVSPELANQSSGPKREEYIQLFQWAPKGHDIAFVLDNDVYVSYANFTKVRRVSKGGSKDVINGIPDWVYEEEVFSSNEAMWFAPSGKSLAYLQFDDSKVPDVQVPLFTNDEILKHANVLDRNPTSPLNDIEKAKLDLNGFADYPQYIKYKYPKSGYTNPTVSLRLFLLNSEVEDTKASGTDLEIEVDINSLKANEVHLDKNALESIQDSKARIITDVVWLDDSKLLFRVTNRVQDVVLTCIADIPRSTAAGSKLRAKVVRLEPAGVDWSKGNQKELKGDGGWYQTDAHPIVPINSETNPKFLDLGLTGVGYIDKVVHNDNYHFALFHPADSSKPLHMLTLGNYDVEAPLGVNAEGRFFYLSREIDSTASHLFSVDLKGKLKKHLSNEEHPTFTTIRNTTRATDPQSISDDLGHFTGSLSTYSTFVFLSYLGPKVPYQVAIVNENLDKAKVLETNQKLEELLKGYALPTTHFKKLSLPGVAHPLDVMEILPPNYNLESNAQLSLLFRCYGGPEIKLVKRDFAFNFHTYLVSNLTNLGVVTVDNRGTSFKSRSFATSVTKQLGKLEAEDQLNTIAKYGSYPWVDAHQIGLWGSSYGGYLTAKSLEADTHHLLKLAISVAPVIDWKFYDSIYTERYMKTPQTNFLGYQSSQVANMTNFVGRNFMLLHGNSDDNVHLQNSLLLLKKFELNKVQGMEFYTYPDNNHAIQIKSSNYLHYKRMDTFVKKHLGRS